MLHSTLALSQAIGEGDHGKGAGSFRDTLLKLIGAEALPYRELTAWFYDYWPTKLTVSWWLSIVLYA